MWLIFRGLNFSRNTDSGQIGHLWMGTNLVNQMPWIIATLPRCIHRPAGPIVAALIAGIALGAWLPGFFWPAVSGLILFSALMVRNVRRGRPGVIWPVLSCVLMGYISIQPWLVDTVPQNHVSRFVGDQTWQIGGVIAEQPRLNGDRWRFVLAVDGLQAGKQCHAVSGRVMVSGRAKWPGACQGDRVVFSGRLRTIRNFANPGGFDYERFMALQAVRARVYAKAGTLKIAPGKVYRGWQARLDQYRGQLADCMGEALNSYPQPTVQLLEAILIGNRDQISPRERQAFNRAGVGHVLAISGLHIGMVATVSFAVAKWLLSWIPLMLRRAWTRKGAALISLGPVIGYGLLSGLAPSTQRAMLMVAVFLIGFWVGRRHDWFNTLALAGLIILLFHPPALLSISFQLSFMAVLAILAGLTVRSGRSPELNAPIWRRLLGRFVSFVQVSLLAILGTLPLVLYYFNQVSIAGLAVNLVVVPLVGAVIVPAGLAGVAATVLNVELATLLWQVAAMGADVVRITVHWAAQRPWSAIQCVSPSGLEICLYYLTGALLLYWPRIVRPKAVLAAVLVLIATDGGYWIYQRFGRQDLRVTVIDVGQGTANLLQFPGGYTALVDGGGFSDNTAFDVGAKIVAPLLWRQKIATVDLLVLSHANSDHINGLLFILEHFKVKEIWSNGQTSPGAGFRQWERLIAALHKRHLKVGQLSAPKVIHGVRLEVLAPPGNFLQRLEMEPWRDLNNNSLVVQARYHEISFLFTGDIMAGAEEELVARLGSQGLQSTILIVPHHGSRSSSTSFFLKAVDPREALISSGWRNRFGFPHDQVLQRLAQMGVRTWCTANHGAIQVVTNGRQYEIMTCRASRD
jgi:competence protein ComEC